MNTSNVTSQVVKRGRPRRLEAVVCGGDELISALACGVVGLSVDVGVEKVSVDAAEVVKANDESNELFEREVMCEEDDASMLERRRERDEVKKEEKRLEREEKRLEREALKLEKKNAALEEKAAKKEEKRLERLAAADAKKADKAKAKEEAKALKAAEKEAKKAEKAAATEAAKAAKKAAKEAAKATKKEEKKAATEAAKAAKKAAKKADKKTKTKSAAPELLAAVSLSREDEELVPQAYLGESEGSADVPMKKQPSTGYEAPMRSGDSFCDP